MKNLLDYNHEGECKHIILDIDNCVLDSREWEKYVPEDNSREGWDNYQKHHFLTKPNKDIVYFLSKLYMNGLEKIDFVTAREDINDMREITINHLNNALKNVYGWDNIRKRLFMRRAFDYRSTAKVKEEILLNFIFPLEYVDLAIDDDERNIEMYKEYNINTLHYTKYKA